MALDDYGALIRSGMAIVPDYLDTLSREEQLKNAKLQNEAGKLAIIKAGLEAQREASFQSDLQGVMADPTAANISRLMMKYPQQADNLKKAWDVKDKATQDSDITQLSEIWSALDNGRPDLAAKSARARLDAETAAGTADAQDAAVVEALESGDPAKVAQVKGMIGIQLAAHAGPEHFGSVADALNPKPVQVAPGAELVDPKTNKLLYSSPYKPQIWTDQTSGITYSLRPTQGGGATPSSSGTVPGDNGGATGFDRAISFVLGAEGGYNPSDRNGAPVNKGINLKANPPAVLNKYGITDIRNVTDDQAKALYLGEYWGPSGAANLAPDMQTPYFDTYVLNPKMAKKLLASSGGNPMRFIELRRNWLKSLERSGKYDKAWTARTDALEQMLHSSGNGYYGKDGTAPMQTATVGGKTYYKINGQWFDNPEGK